MDTDHQADEAWVLNVQRKLYQWSKANPDDAWREMWNWVTDIRNLRHAWRRVASNKGRRSAGIDGMTVARVQAKIGEQRFLVRLRSDLRSGAYWPSPSRRETHPEAWKTRAVPTPGHPHGRRSRRAKRDQECLGADLRGSVLACLVRVSARPGLPRSLGAHPESHPAPQVGGGWRRHTAPYAWVIEGDIRSCFDHIDHHLLLDRLRRRVTDRKVIRLIGQFLKAGVLSEQQFLRTEAGTPQGGILTP